MHGSLAGGEILAVDGEGLFLEVEGVVAHEDVLPHQCRIDLNERALVEQVVPGGAHYGHAGGEFIGSVIAVSRPGQLFGAKDFAAIAADTPEAELRFFAFVVDFKRKILKVIVGARPYEVEAGGIEDAQGGIAEVGQVGAFALLDGAFSSQV